MTSSVAYSSTSEQKVSESTIERREILPENILPIHYFLSYSKIDFDGDFAFEGRVEIDLDIKSCTNAIILNSRDIQCKCVSVVQNTDEQLIDIQSLQYCQEKEQLTIPLTNELIVGTAKLFIDFTGFMNNKMKGFYRSKYCTADGKPAFCGITQFEPVDARCAFPCFDEPGKKATFSVQLTFPADLICLANMPPVKETIIDSTNGCRLKCVLFDRTPIMSVYLLAWCIGEFEYIENKTERGIAVRLWTTAGNTNKVEFALKCACRCLDFYEGYFGINYPLPKCDMIAVPDFAAGAMENWGLVTYREARLMCDESTAALRVKQRISLVICHELAHQWFGNLVTMDWWSQIWLNEGFARFMEYFCTDALFPDWNIWYLFFPAAFNRAFSLDAMRNSHAIEMDNIFTHSDIEQVFDSIAYAKGAAVVRMVVSFVGYEVFQKALHKYLEHFQYKNAKTNQLWAFLSQESGKPMADIMGNWTRKQGFPLICVSRAGNELTFTQMRYLSFGEPTEEENTIWNVPICMKLDGNASKVVQFVLKSRKDTFDISSSISNNKCDWVHINADSTGFYCCKYDSQMMQSLNKSLMINDGQLSVVDRVCLIRDLRALAISCNTKTATLQLLDLVQSLSTKEKTYLVWNEMLTATANISHVINCTEDDTEVYNKFKSIMRGILQHMYQDLQWQPKCSSNVNDITENESKSKENTVNAKEVESETTKDLFRPLILSSMIKYGHEDVIQETLKRYHSFMNLMFTENTDVNVACSSTDAVCILPSALRSMAYGCAVKYGGEKEYNLLKKYYLQVSDSIEKRSALRCLGKTQNIGLMESTLEWLLVSEDVRPQDKMFVFYSIAHASNKGKELAWDFLRKKWKIFFDMFDGGFQMSSLVKIPSGFVSNDKAEEVELFFQSLDQASISGCYRGINQCVEQIRKNAKWRDSELLNIQKWCLNNYKGKQSE